MAAFSLFFLNYYSFFIHPITTSSTIMSQVTQEEALRDEQLMLMEKFQKTQDCLTRRVKCYNIHIRNIKSSGRKLDSHYKKLDNCLSKAPFDADRYDDLLVTWLREYEFFASMVTQSDEVLRGAEADKQFEGETIETIKQLLVQLQALHKKQHQHPIQPFDALGAADNIKRLLKEHSRVKSQWRRWYHREVSTHEQDEKALFEVPSFL